MAELVHYLLDPQTDPPLKITVEVNEDHSGFEEASPRRFPSHVENDFSAAVAHGRRAVEVAFEQFRQMADTPDEITMSVGLTMSGGAGAVLARTASEGNIVLTLVWRQADR